MNLGQEIVIPIVKDQHNFLNAFFLAKHVELLEAPDINNNGTFVEFGGTNFMNIGIYNLKILKPGKTRLSPSENLLKQQREGLIGDLKRDIFIQGTNYDQDLQKYQTNDHILYDFCAGQNDASNNEYVFLVRNKGENNFRLPESLNGQVFVPVKNNKNIIIVFLEVEVDEGGKHYYNLIVSKNATSQRVRYPYCTRYVIKRGSAGTLGCNLEDMGKQQQVVAAIDAAILNNGQNNAELERFKELVKSGLSPQQLDQTNIDAAVTQDVGPPTPSVSSASTSSEYTPSVNERVKNMFADLPSFTQTLSPGENVCADKMIIEMLKTNTRRPSLFSGGRRYKKTTQRRRDSLYKRNKTKRRVYKNV